ncbi:WD40-like Beta Propeller Repeat [Saccharicrinis carchari]|uniref:WD40-like Beta Propeller Repeat n=1 Tax=Saccharicrinis carchari TaxID=1168039 RepID=A0A521DHP3_SACCC|nr:tetratricopeptide repeat protein [Saccharicrinis carchari]SMO71284.1 WD40-like Beta Propeller Repeat [Saccharicrinis carchari]
MSAKSNLFAVCIALLLSIQSLSGQNNNPSVTKMFNLAVSFAEKEDYEQAIPLFKRVAEEEPENINVLYNLGHSYLNAKGGHDSALVYFSKAVELLKPENYYTELGVDLHLSKAKSMQMLYRYKDALGVYHKMLDFTDEDETELREMISREIEISNNGIKFMKNPVKLEVHNLGSTINSSYDDHSPLVSADESIVIFTSRRKSSYSQMLNDGQFSEKIYTAKKENEKWGKAKVIKEVQKRDSHESALCLSADGSELYLLRSDFDGQNLYVSEFDGEIWSEPFMLPQGINSRYNETHASINADKSMLFFTSDRKGGEGGLDIYMVRKLPNGKWGTPKSLGPDINTPYDEETPMIHPDGKTLFFSSEGHNTMGNFDIFYSRMKADSSWSEPVNMGYPINTPDDDFFFVPTAAENRAYMASSRFEENYGGSDLYAIEYEQPEIERLAVIKGKLNAGREYAWDDVLIQVKEKGTDHLVGEYSPNPVSGKYMFILEAEKTYDIEIMGENIENTVSSLTVSRDMTYLNQSQSVETEDVMVKGLLAAVKTETKTGKDEVTDTDKAATMVRGKYTVQFVTLKKPLDNYDAYRQLDKDKIMLYKGNDGNYRYVYGSFNSFKDAKKAKHKVIEATGYDDPFVRYFWQLDKMKAED